VVIVVYSLARTIYYIVILYVQVLRALVSSLSQLIEFMVDFGRALWRASNKCFPNSDGGERLRLPPDTGCVAKSAASGLQTEYSSKTASTN